MVMYKYILKVIYYFVEVLDKYIIYKIIYTSNTLIFLNDK